MPFRLLCYIALFCVPALLSAQAQVPQRYQVYAGYSFLSNSFNGIPGSHQPLNGWDASFGFPPWHDLRFKIDVFGYGGTNLGAQQNPFFIMGGGQYGHRFGRESAFVEALFGDCGLNRDWGPNRSPGMTASFSTLLGGGLDTPLARHFAFRVNAGYEWENFALIQSVSYPQPYRPPGLPNNFARISSGLVWKF